jgi:hypothetical protein
MRRLVFVHGRAQEHQAASALKGKWLAALREGLARSTLELPIAEADIRFPYYGQTLFDLVAGVPSEQAAEIIVRGQGMDTEERSFIASMMKEIFSKTGVTNEQIAEVLATDVVERGPLSWAWIQAGLRVIDRHVPFGSGASIALFTRDVYQYLRNIGLRDRIETGIRLAIQSDVPTIVVGHSLGTIVSYSLLRREGQTRGWNVPLYVTLGSPLAVTAIKRNLAPNRHPECVGRWLNAMDKRDVVALYPLSKAHFPIDPEVENKTDVSNQTENRHGIAGYLNDPVVARRIYDALVE